MAKNVWALTSYYNPIRYGTKLKNFRRFHEKLTVPLVAVELGFDGQWDLSDSDADIVVRVDDGSILWQKERLLNIGLKHLPHEATHVAWLDCDVIFEDKDWSENGVKALRHARLIQPFTQLVDLRNDQGAKPVGVSMGHLMRDFVPRPNSTLQMQPVCFGFAWMAERSTLDACGFYDAMVMGSGDRAMALAAIGKYDDAMVTIRLNEARQTHYLKWAHLFHSIVQDKVAALPGRLFHLWHGELEDRRYLERHEAFAAYDFDPETDLSMSASGALRWKCGRNDLESFARNYFESRREDGRLAPLGCGQ